MKKQIAFSLVLVMLLGLLAGCAGTAVVYYGECTCPTGGNTPAPTDPVNPPAEGAVKTGLSVITNVSKSANATCAEYDVTLVAVTVDDGGVSRSCVIDGIAADLVLANEGTIKEADEVLTKN